MQIDAFKNLLLWNIAKGDILESNLATQRYRTIVRRFRFDNLWRLIQNILNAFRARGGACCHVGQLGEIFHWLKELGKQGDKENDSSNIDTLRGNDHPQAEGAARRDIRANPDNNSG